MQIKSKNIQNLPQYQGNFPPLTPLFPITHSHTRVVLSSPPPSGELSLTVCSPPSLLSQFPEAWQALPGVSEWVMKSIKNSYTLQFFRRPPHFNGVLMSTVRERECLSSARGNTQSSRKAHCRDSAPHRLRERLLQSLFSGAKERRRTPPNLGSETAESRASEALIQNDYAEANPLTHQTGGQVYLRGFKGCLFSHSGSPPPQDSVPIHGPAPSAYPWPLIHLQNAWMLFSLL